MTSRLNEEQIREIRELVKLGALKYKVAEKFNVDTDTIWYHTRDLVIRKRKITNDIREKIIKRTLETGDRKKVSEEFKISYLTVCKIVRDLMGRKEQGIRGSALRILQQIDKFGYFVPDPGNQITQSYRTLKKYMPNTINKVSFRRCVIIYDERRKMEAFKAFMGKRRNRIISSYKCQAIMSRFGICKPPKEARKLLGEIGFVDYEHPKRRKFKKLEKDDSQEAV